MTLLCKLHHSEKTAKLLPLADVIKANENPKNLSKDISKAYDLHYSGQACEAIIGSNTHGWPVLAEGEITIPLLVDDTPILMFRVQDGHLLLTVQIFDKNNQLTVQIVDNELKYSTKSWDVELEGRVLTVRNGLRNIHVSLKLNPPNSIVVERGTLYRNGLNIDIWPDRVEFMGSTLQSNRVANCVIGVAIGDPPDKIGGAMLMYAPKRHNFVVSKPTEQQVIRFGKNKPIENV